MGSKFFYENICKYLANKLFIKLSSDIQLNKVIIFPESVDSFDFTITFRTIKYNNTDSLLISIYYDINMNEFFIKSTLYNSKNYIFYNKNINKFNTSSKLINYIYRLTHTIEYKNKEQVLQDLEYLPPLGNTFYGGIKYLEAKDRFNNNLY